MDDTRSSDGTTDPATDRRRGVGRNKYLLLLISHLVLLLVYPIEHSLGVLHQLPGLKILTLVVVIAGVHAVCKERWLRNAGTALWVAALILGTLGETSGSSAARAFDLAAEVVAMLAVLVLILLILRDMFGGAAAGITGDRLLGAACAYMLMGVVWCSLYTVLDQTASRNQPAFSLGPPPTVGADADGDLARARRWRLLYFSFVTMTTLGYGDITPKTPPAEAAVLLQAVVGQFYLTILVAFLVGLRLATWMKERVP